MTHFFHTDVMTLHAWSLLLQRVFSHRQELLFPWVVNQRQRWQRRPLRLLPLRLRLGLNLRP
ncbi:hypothetical protein F442_22699 [Phytophthora nicotianae P10297]|uniref:Uncharacterized protein n=1 Tax=Phytophthora nicotianae P10297 TaxID=1317064 RepID=W2XZ70_PHYNI|nr:hypothetical protein F442_22699 [Phytophthora nicotianae P10297]